MKYLPFEDFEIHTKLDSDEIFYKLCSAVDMEGKSWIFTNKPFWGEVDRRGFRIWRTTWWNRNFTPIVFGKIWSEGSGCCILIRMRMPWFGFLFYSLVFGFLWFSFFVSQANLVVQRIQAGIWQIESPLDYLFSIAIFALLFLFLPRVFKGETSRIKNYLLWLWNSTEEDINYRDEFLGFRESQIIKSIFLVTFAVTLGWSMFGLL
jgi:hypothetical protein